MATDERLRFDAENLLRDHQRIERDSAYHLGMVAVTQEQWAALGARLAVAEAERKQLLAVAGVLTAARAVVGQAGWAKVLYGCPNPVLIALDRALTTYDEARAALAAEELAAPDGA